MTLRSIARIQRRKHSLHRDAPVAFDDKLFQVFPADSAFCIAANPSILRTVGCGEKARALEQNALLLRTHGKSDAPSVVITVQYGKLLLAGYKRGVSPGQFFLTLRKRKADTAQTRE